MNVSRVSDLFFLSGFLVLVNEHIDATENKNLAFMYRMSIIDLVLCEKIRNWLLENFEPFNLSRTVILLTFWSIYFR